MSYTVRKVWRDILAASVPSPRPAASIKSIGSQPAKKSPAIFGHWTHRSRYHLRYSRGVSPRNECHCFRTLSIFFGMAVASVLSFSFFFFPRFFLFSNSPFLLDRFFAVRAPRLVAVKMQLCAIQFCFFFFQISFSLFCSARSRLWNKPLGSL